MKKFYMIFLSITLFLFICSASVYAKDMRTTANLNCRTYPSMDGDIVTVFPHNSTVTVIDTYNGWYKVSKGNTVGWVWGWYLSETSGRQYIGDFKVTYYTPSPKENGGWNVTAKGQKLKDVVGICVAADPKVIPYYSRIYIEGVGERTVLDCGGAIKGKRLDVLANSIPSKGVHYSKVYLLK